jgi:hypothetical protein
VSADVPNKLQADSRYTVDGAATAAPASAPSVVNQLEGDVHGSVVQAERIDKVEQHFHPVPAGDQVPRLVFGTTPPRAGAFQDRRVAAELAGAVVSGSTAVLTGAGSRVVAGLGGVGKTQLAAEHARTLWFSGKLDVLMWVGATSRDAVLSAYGQAAAAIDGVARPDAERAADRWLEWLAATQARWLVVLDDVQDPADVRGLWPPHTPTGALVVTTRRRDAAFGGDGRRIVEVGLFTAAESIAFLTERLAGRPTQVVGAAELADELGHLPVALAQAAAYIADRAALTCASYCSRWRDRRRTLAQVLPDEGELPDEHRATVATTWSLSIEQADRLDPAGLARLLLQVTSLLDPNGIPDAIFATPAILSHLRIRTGREVDGDTAVDALSCLHRLSLITHDPDTPHRAVRVHARGQRATRETLHADGLAAVVRVAANALIEAWPKIERDTDLAAVLRSNTDALRAAADNLLWEPRAHAVLFRTGDSLGDAGQLAAAVDYFSELCMTAERRLGADHRDTLLARRHLVRWRGKAGDPVDAAAQCEQVLADCERVWGIDHPDTLAARRDLARWRGQAGAPAGAAAALEQMVSDHERVLGVDHPDTLRVRMSITYWRGLAGDSAGAAAALKPVITDYQRVYGSDDPRTLTARSYRACVARAVR